MKATISKLNQDENDLLLKVKSKMGEIQAEIDSAMIPYNAAKDALNKEKEVIKPLREKLTPYAEMAAAVASPSSRDKYFPEMTKSQFQTFVRSELDG